MIILVTIKHNYDNCKIICTTSSLVTFLAIKLDEIFNYNRAMQTNIKSLRGNKDI